MKLNKTNIKVLTPTGFKPFVGIQKLEKECLEIVLSNNNLKCSKNHRILTKDNVFKISNDLKIGDIISTKNGFDKIIDIINAGTLPVYDLLEVETNQYYTNDIISHNCEFDEVGESAIDDELFDEMKRNTFQPLYVFDEGKYLLWEIPNEEKIYVAGVDIAEGIGKDASVIQLLDITNPKRIKQVAIYHNNKISPSEFTPKLKEILEHWGNPLVLIERNGCGSQVVDNLKREYNYENIISWGGNKIAGRTSSQYGIISHINTKSVAITNQRYFVNVSKSVQINDINTVLELKDYVKTKHSWGAKHGAHDDRVSALTWGLLILHEELVSMYFDVIEKDSNNKPSIIKSIDYGIKYFINPTSIYTNEKNGMAVDALPTIMSNSMYSEQPEIEDLIMQGWKPLS
jgi:hypothetical protein